MFVAVLPPWEERRKEVAVVVQAVSHVLLKTSKGGPVAVNGARDIEITPTVPGVAGVGVNRGEGLGDWDMHLLFKARDGAIAAAAMVALILAGVGLGSHAIIFHNNFSLLGYGVFGVVAPMDSAYRSLHLRGRWLITLAMLSGTEFPMPVIAQDLRYDLPF